MTNYPFQIMTDTIGSYWHDFSFSTSGQAAEYTNTLLLSGDIYERQDLTTGETCSYTVSPQSIKVIKVFLGNFVDVPIEILTELGYNIITEDGFTILKG
jgi:hypothetical protein